MELIKNFSQLTREVIKSATDQKNQGIATISGLTGIFCSWHIATFDVGNFFLKYALPFKIIGGLFSILIAPPLGVFMSDLYKIKVRPLLFKKKKNY